MRVQTSNTVNLDDDDRRAIAFMLDGHLTDRKADHAECVMYVRRHGSDMRDLLREYYLAKSEEYADMAAEYYGERE